MAAAVHEGIKGRGILDGESDLKFLLEFRLGRSGAEDAGERSHELEKSLGDCFSAVEPGQPLVLGYFHPSRGFYVKGSAA